jgi:hypothetical protein
LKKNEFIGEIFKSHAFACKISVRPKICEAPKDKFASRADDSIKNELAQKLGSSAERATESTFKQNKFDNSSGSVSKQQFNGE